MESIIPSRIYTLFPEIGFDQLATYPRINKWSAALGFIVKRPLFGWGAASFPFIYSFYKMNFVNDKIQHSHNLFFETSISYGIIFSTIIFILFFRLKFYI